MGNSVQCVLPPTEAPRTLLLQFSTSGGVEYTPLDRRFSVTQYDSSRPPLTIAAHPKVRATALR